MDHSRFESERFFVASNRVFLVSVSLAGLRLAFWLYTSAPIPFAIVAAVFATIAN